MSSVPSILDKIIAQKQKRLDLAKTEAPLPDLKRQANLAPASRDFAGSLLRSGPVAVIAEIKRRSPSKGLLAEHLDPRHMARSYEEAGAAAISVITEEDFFSGCPQDLIRARSETSLPVLRKDFIFDLYQIYESRAMGADAILLIVSCLGRTLLRSLLSTAHQLNMSAVVEVHTRDEAEIAVEAGAWVIGINNRDLRSFDTDLSITEGVAPVIPEDRLIVSESGIKARADVIRAGKAGARAVLVGESLVKASREQGGIKKGIEELLNGRQECDS